MFLLLLWVLTIPVYPYSRGWGYYPFGGLTALLLIFLLLWWIGIFAVVV